LVAISVALAVLVVIGVAIFALHGNQTKKTIPKMAVSYTGVNYYDPTDFFTKCPDFTWLQASCYASPKRPIPPSRQLASDLVFVRSSHIGSFMRVWVSLDELMKWDPRNGYLGYDPTALANVDSALSQFAAQGIKVDLVLLVYSKGSHWLKQFHPEALDGKHETMRSGYLQAVHDFIAHLASNPTAKRTVAVMDLQTEPYYQLEQYFNDASHLHAFKSCNNGTGTARNDCVDRDIVHPWLLDLYRTARSASTTFNYTFADTGRLLTADRTSQQFWVSMYPVDVYDIHMYDDTPWNDTPRWASYTNLDKPWFAGEAGCGSGNVACTYNGQRALPVDSWWLGHLKSYGAQAVLIESHVTVWMYPNGPSSQTLTPTGQAVACTADRFHTPCHS
jgi:hypothetical protein